ncbi:MAG: hypothetical protein QXW67_03705 [Candidatus Micrarchaeia archaeon]
MLLKEYIVKVKKENRPQLITAPIHLSNDSFGTNRSSSCFGKVEVPSRESVYPQEIIIDFNLLEQR